MSPDFLRALKESGDRLPNHFNFFLIGTLIILLGICTLLWGAYQYAQAYRSSQWPSTEGVILYSDSSRSGPGSSRFGLSINERIRYQYSVHGKTYSDNKVYFGANGSDYSVVGKYPRGAQIRVSYDPGAPQNSVLEPGIKKKNYFVFLSGMLLVLFGVLMQKGYLWLARTGKLGSNF